MQSTLPIMSAMWLPITSAAYESSAREVHLMRTNESGKFARDEVGLAWDSLWQHRAIHQKRWLSIEILQGVSDLHTIALHAWVALRVSKGMRIKFCIHKRIYNYSVKGKIGRLCFVPNMWRRTQLLSHGFPKVILQRIQNTSNVFRQSHWQIICRLVIIILL